MMHKIRQTCNRETAPEHSEDDLRRLILVYTVCSGRAGQYLGKYSIFEIWFGLEFNGPANTVKVLSSRSVYLTTLF